MLKEFGYFFTTNSDAEATIMQEVVGHKGLRLLLGDRFDSFLDSVADSLEF